MVMPGNMGISFVDLENIFYPVPREMLVAIVRWKVVSEAEARMVKTMYEKTKEA